MSIWFLLLIPWLRFASPMWQFIDDFPMKKTCYPTTRVDHCCLCYAYIYIYIHIIWIHVYFICTTCIHIYIYMFQLHLLGALNTRHACIVYAARSYPCSHPFIFMSRKLASTSRSYSCYSKELDGRSVSCAVFKSRISGLFVVEVTCSIGFELLVGFEPILAWVGVRSDVNTLI